MAGRSRDAATYQSHYLTNRGAGETFDAYSALVTEDAAVTRCRYAFLVIMVVVNLSMSIGVLCYSIHSRLLPPKPSSKRWTSSTTRTSEDWIACRALVTYSGTAPYCAVINDDFYSAASNVTAFHGFFFIRMQCVLVPRIFQWRFGAKEGEASAEGPRAGWGS